MSTQIDWIILVIAEAGNALQTERVDRFVIGGKDVVLPWMGAFGIRDIRITAWRAYFDMAT